MCSEIKQAKIKPCVRAFLPLLGGVVNCKSKQFFYENSPLSDKSLFECYFIIQSQFKIAKGILNINNIKRKLKIITCIFTFTRHFQLEIMAQCETSIKSIHVEGFAGLYSEKKEKKKKDFFLHPNVCRSNKQLN